MMMVMTNMLESATKLLDLFSKALMGLVWWWALTRPNAEKAFCGFPGEESAFARVEQVEDLFEYSHTKLIN